MVLHQMFDEWHFSLLQSYGSLHPVKALRWPSSSSADGIQNFLVNQLILSDHFQSYPPSAKYQWSFWKWIIAYLEEQGEEVREEIYPHYLALLDQMSIGTVTSDQVPQPSYVTYMWRDLPGETSNICSSATIRRCTLFEARTTIESGTTGLRTWTASFVLADYLLSNRDLFKSKRVLELGSGAGFLGIILGQLQIESSDLTETSRKVDPALYLTDLNEQVLARCESNLKLPCNGTLSHPSLDFLVLDWSNVLYKNRRSSLSALLGNINADVILGADVVYDTSNIPSLVATLQLALTSDQARQSEKMAIIAATIRNEDTLHEFVRQVQKSGLYIEEIEVVKGGLSTHFFQNQPDMAGERLIHVKLFTIRKQATS